MTVYGWDASDFDWDRGPMDLGAARRAGIDFFTHKATEGTRTKHKHFGEAMRRARDAGIPFIGAYVVPRTPGSGGHGSIAAQADYLIAYIDATAPWLWSHPGFFLQTDTEHWVYDKVSAQVGNAMCVELRRRKRRTVLHYAPEWAYGGSIPQGFDLWASNYVNGSGQFKGLYPGDGSSRWHAYSGRVPKVLQYSSNATIGRQPRCDANAFRGTVADFAALIGAEVAPPQIEGDDMKSLPFLAIDDKTGAVFVCDLVESRWIRNEEVLTNIGYLAGQLGIDLTVHQPVNAEEAKEWTPEGIRKGWSEDVFGKLIGDVPPGLADTDEAEEEPA